MNSEDTLARPNAQPTIVVLRGFPGAGKSTVAADLVATTPTAAVCRDTIREVHFHSQGVLDRNHEDEVSRIEFDQAVAHLGAGRNVVVDSTNLRPAYVHRWQELAARLGVPCVLVDVHAPIHVCVARVAARHCGGGRDVPADAILNLYRAHPPESWSPPADLTIDTHTTGPADDEDHHDTAVGNDGRHATPIRAAHRGRPIRSRRPRPRHGHTHRSMDDTATSP